MRVYLLCGEKYCSSSQTIDLLMENQRGFLIDYHHISMVGANLDSQLHLFRRQVRRSKGFECVVINATGLGLKERNRLLKPYRHLQQNGSAQLIGVGIDNHKKTYPRYRELFDKVIDMSMLDKENAA